MDNRQPTPSHTSLGIDNPMLSNILNRMLTLWTLAGIAALLFSLSRMAETGWLLLYDIQIAVVSLIIAVQEHQRSISEVFAATRFTANVVHVMNRTVERGDLPPDQTIWLQNPAATCLEQLLELV